MPRPASDLLTERETQLMDVLWDRGPSTAEDVRRARRDEPHDSTVRTMLGILRRKGYIRVRRRQPATYEAVVPRARVQGRAAQNLLKRFFGGEAEALVMRLVEDEKLTAEQLDRLRKKIARIKRRGDKP